MGFWRGWCFSWYSSNTVSRLCSLDFRCGWIWGRGYNQLASSRWWRSSNYPQILSLETTQLGIVCCSFAKCSLNQNLGNAKCCTNSFHGLMAYKSASSVVPNASYPCCLSSVLLRLALTWTAKMIGARHEWGACGNGAVTVGKQCWASLMIEGSNDALSWCRLWGWMVLHRYFSSLTHCVSSGD
jgi:hypothetical protein